MIRTTWRALQTFSAAADAYLKRNGGQETKIKYAIKRVREQLPKHQEAVQIALADLEIDICEVDDKNVILRDQHGNLCFTRESIKERNRRQRDLVENYQVEIDPHFVDPLPPDLTGEEIMAFSGLVIATSNGNGGPPESDRPNPAS